MPIGPSRPLILHTPEAIDLRQAARYLGAQGQPDDAFLALLERCAPPLLQAAAPRAAWLLADTETLEERGILQGTDIRRHLSGCPRAILLAVTLGPMTDAAIRRAAVGDIAAGATADALASALAEQMPIRRRRRCANGPPEKASTSQGASPPATATGPSPSSRWWPMHWTPSGKWAFTSPTPVS